jgi:hypothetical protein
MARPTDHDGIEATSLRGFASEQNSIEVISDHEILATTELARAHPSL